MGRIKGLLCSFCFNSESGRANEHAFNQDIDVSHLATPHIPSDLRVQSHLAITSTITNGHNRESYLHQHSIQSSNGNLVTSQHDRQLDSVNINRDTPDRDGGSNLYPSETFQQQNSHPSTPSTTHNIHESQPSPRVAPTPEVQQNLYSPAPQHIDAQADATPPPQPSTSNGATTKLSYDIISVREPLAKILAERQQLLIAQQQQHRQLIGDYEYIEVYGERGSSCFYEEIAGSVTSSATYDQIGAISNHNYQVLLNNYDANRQIAPNQGDSRELQINSEGDRTASRINGQNPRENNYDASGLPGQLKAGPSTSSQQHRPVETNQGDPSDDRQLAQSIPVYSVINKATRRNNSVMRMTAENDLPPRPPPKNLLYLHQQQTISAMQAHQDQLYNSPQKSMPTNLPHTPSSGSHMNDYNSHEKAAQIDTDSSQDGLSGDRLNPLPKPPPRFSKNQMFHPSDRPLPLPDNSQDSNNNINRQLNRNGTDYDSEALDNGYELLRSNMLEDDQIDVGYERIREPNRYSGGSISSQFCPRQILDNGGYESVQPIYSSPSNALVEPNYEAITPSTASELAANATAKLTAAASVIEQILKKDR